MHSGKKFFFQGFNSKFCHWERNGGEFSSTLEGTWICFLNHNLTTFTLNAGTVS